MALVALVCAGAGTFEIHRFQEKRHDNGALRANAHAAVAPLTTALVPLVHQGRAPGADAIRYRRVTASGVYQPAREQYVGNPSQGGRQGFYVLTPLRTSDGTLLVVRGFVAATSSGTRPASVAPAPAGTVDITGRLQTAQTSNDQLGRLGHGEITSVNPVQQSGRLGQPTFQAYVTLDADQPGTSGVSVVPNPSLSNPSGGAGELQLLSYVVQWYAFTLLALAAPFLFARAEVRDAQRRFLGIDPDATPLELGGGRSAPRPLPEGAPAGAAVAVRSSGTLAEREGVTPERWQRAARLADRYGRSLGADGPPALRPGGPAPEPAARRRIGGVPDAPARPTGGSLHRSDDSYHGSYNDYLWQLALADGELADMLPAASAPHDESGPPALEVPPDPGAPAADDDTR